MHVVCFFKPQPLNHIFADKPFLTQIKASQISQFTDFLGRNITEIFLFRFNFFISCFDIIVTAYTQENRMIPVVCLQG